MCTWYTFNICWFDLFCGKELSDKLLLSSLMCCGWACVQMHLYVNINGCGHWRCPREGKMLVCSLPGIAMERIVFYSFSNSYDSSKAPWSLTSMFSEKRPVQRVCSRPLKSITFWGVTSELKKNKIFWLQNLLRTRKTHNVFLGIFSLATKKFYICFQ